MKKIIIALFVVTVMFLLTSNKEEEVLIPRDAIRFRIIASSNKLEDQATKLEVKKDLEPIISNILNNSNNIKETRSEIQNNMNDIKKTISNHVKNYNINYGINHFPEKTYKGITYAEGDYESLVVTLGDGLGDNWWCVLFPPLCLLEASADNYDDYTYSFYIKDVINRYF